MTREEHLGFCKICKKQEFDFNLGVICGLTNQLAAFEDNCISFEEDASLKNKIMLKKLEDGTNNKPTGLSKRIANRIIDMIIINIPVIFVFAFYMFSGIIYVFIPNLMGILMVFYILSLISGLFYYTFFETIFGRTIGKLITRTKVVDYKGNTPSFGRIILRYMYRSIPFESFSILGDAKAGWHDTKSKTIVVDL